LISSSLCFSASQDLEMEMDYIGGSCSEYFAMIEMEFTNNSNQWMNLSKQQLGFDGGEANGEVTILTGNKLLVWSEAMTLGQRRSNIVSGLISGALGALSLGVINDGNRNFSALGKVGMLALAGNLTADAVAAIKSEYRGEIFPKNHFLREDILIPPGFTVTRWALLNTLNNPQDRYITTMNLDFELQGKSQSREFTMRVEHDFSVSGCDWQESLQPPLVIEDQEEDGV